MNLCVVDDEHDVCDILRLYFESRGHRCHLAHDGVTGLEMIRRIKPDAVFLDLQMPRKNGFEVLTEIRNDPELASLPVMMMTGLTKDEKGMKDSDWARSANADAFLTKPFELDQLLETVQSLVGESI